MTSTTDFATVYRNHLAKIDNAKGDAATELRTLYLYLRSQYPDLRYIEVEYEGSGDSGQVDSIFYGANKESEHVAPFSYLKDKAEVDDAQPLPDAVAKGREHQPGEWQPGVGWVKTGERSNITAEQLISQLAWDLAYGQNPGFEINEGGFGKVNIAADEDDPSLVRVSLSHSERITETNDYEYEL